MFKADFRGLVSVMPLWVRIGREQRKEEKQGIWGEPLACQAASVGGTVPWYESGHMRWNKRKQCSRRAVCNKVLRGTPSGRADLNAP